MKTMAVSITVVMFAIFTSKADAQQTPSNYCSSLPANQCEVLNVDNNMVYDGSNVISIVTVKYCKNRQFKILFGRMIFGYLNGSLYPQNSGNNTIYTQEGFGTKSYNITDCSTLP